MLSYNYPSIDHQGRNFIEDLHKEKLEILRRQICVLLKGLLKPLRNIFDEICSDFELMFDTAAQSACPIHIHGNGTIFIGFLLLGICLDSCISLALQVCFEGEMFDSE